MESQIGKNLEIEWTSLLIKELPLIVVANGIPNRASSQDYNEPLTSMNPKMAPRGPSLLNVVMGPFWGRQDVLGPVTGLSF